MMWLDLSLEQISLENVHQVKSRRGNSRLKCTLFWLDNMMRSCFELVIHIVFVVVSVLHASTEKDDFYEAMYLLMGDVAIICSENSQGPGWQSLPLNMFIVSENNGTRLGFEQEKRTTIHRKVRNRPIVKNVSLGSKREDFTLQYCKLLLNC